MRMRKGSDDARHDDAEGKDRGCCEGIHSKTPETMFNVDRKLGSRCGEQHKV